MIHPGMSFCSGFLTFKEALVLSGFALIFARTAIAQTKKFQGMVENLESMGLLQLLFQVMHGALMDWQGGATLQTG